MNKTEADTGRATLDFLACGGEMGLLIGSIDWSDTPLGPIERWPPSLRTTVSLCVGTKFPISMTWGPQHNTLYNDSYLPIAGDKHPKSLGQNYREIWAAAWPWFGDAYDRAVAGEPAYLENQRIFLDRNGFLEETFFTFSFSPVRDESGAVRGVFNPASETTAIMLSERRTRTLRDLTARASKAQTVEAVLVLAAETLADYDLDLPFVLFYLVDARKGVARLASSAGVRAGTAASPETVALQEDADGSWPLAEVVRAGEPVEVRGLASRFGSLPGGPYPEPPGAALALPLTPPGCEEPMAVLVAGVSARLPLTEEYRAFYDLVAAGVTAALANARAREEEFRRAESLAALDRAKTTFFSNVSHELRTPLTLMLGPLEDELREHPASRPRLEVAHRNSRRLLKLVNTLLDFSRIEAGRVEASFQPTDLPTLTAELASVFRSAIERAGLRLILDCPPLPELVHVDREMWEKVVLNLLSNALKHTFEGEIEVAVRGRGDRVELSVRDTGVGISAAELPRIFDRFHRVRGARSRTDEGTGIGLALVRELVGLHGGDVLVRSEEGVGTTFLVTVRRGVAHLPADRVDAERQQLSTRTSSAAFVDEAWNWASAAPEATADSGIPTPATPTVRGTRPRILLADDNADMREYLRGLLAPHYDVEAVADGQAALECIRTRPPDLTLTDVMMPRLDGFGLLRELRADGRTRATPVILLSARAGEEARLEGLAAGADDYMVKPFSARELLARVRSQVEMARLRREGEERVNRVLESITDGFVVLDTEWRVTYINTAARDNFAGQGLKVDDIVGKHYWDDVFPEARGTREDLEFSRVMEDREPVEYETLYQPWQRWYGVRVFPVEAGGISIYFQDITDRKVAEEALRQATAALAEANRELEAKVEERTARLRETVGELEAFSYSIAHDMRAPLRSMHGFGRFLADEYADKLDATGRNYISRITTSAERMDRLIRDVLDYSQVMRAEAPREVVEVEKLLRGIVDSYPSFQEDGTRIRLEGEFPNVLGNEAALTQCLSNLLGNAVKFVAPGVAPDVRVWSETEGARVRLFVADNGIGIELDQQPRIFTMFQRVSKSYEGTGIGLAIVQKAVTRMGGQVGVRSRLGHGSTFWIELTSAKVG